MPQVHSLITTLKRALKHHGLTYRDVARALKLSEPSVKRLFAQRHFTLARLEQVCGLMQMEIGDLVDRMEAERGLVAELTEAQEEELVADPKLMLVAFLVVNGWATEDIVKSYKLSEAEMIRSLATLDRLRLIELQPQNKVKLLISPNFAWRRDGPIQRFFFRYLQQDYFESRFDKAGEAFRFVAGMLDAQASDALIKKIEQLANDFEELNHAARRVPLSERRASSMILAIRPWRVSAFDYFRRETELRKYRL